LEGIWHWHWGWGVGFQKKSTIGALLFQDPENLEEKLIKIRTKGIP
jgi:hypothetical protein